MSPQIFLFFSSNDQNLADTMENEWEAVGGRLIKEKESWPFLTDPEKLAKRMQKGDYLLLLISEGYMHSHNCLYLALELIYNLALKGNILLLLTEDARLDNPFIRLNFLDYWNIRFRQVEQELEISKNDPASIRELQPFFKIKASIYQFMADINSLICIPWQEAYTLAYQPIFQNTGLDQENIISRCIQINRTSHSHQREKALEELNSTNGDNPYILSSMARVAQESNKYSKAQETYKKLLTKHPDFITGYYQLANLLTAHFQKHPSARRLYEQALTKDATYAEVHHCLAYLLTTQFQEHQLAKEHYVQALQVRPDDREVHLKLAALLRDHFGDYHGARKHLEHACRINFGNAEAHYQLALLLVDPIQDYEAAIKSLERIYHTEAEYPDAQYQLALIYGNYLQLYGPAKELYDHVLHLKPDHVEARLQLAILLEKHFQRYQQAREHLELALVIDSENATAHYHLAVLLAEHFQEQETAKKHYQRALEINLNQSHN